MKKITEWVRHNQGMTCSIVVLAVIAVWLFSCESRVLSLVDPGKKVNRQELNLEVAVERQRVEAQLDHLIKRAELKHIQLDRIDEVKQKLVNFAAITVDAGTVNPAGVVGLLFSIVGIGAVVDNRLKDKVIKNRPLQIPS